jgi:hypothetical protein
VQILQQTNKNIIITGEAGSVFKGNMIIDGGGRSAGEDTLAIRNLKFDKSGTTLSSPVYIIDLKKFSSPTYSYSHNVTIENCSFVGDDSGAYTYAIQAGSSGGNTAFNVKVLNCTFDNVKCVVQARCTGLTIEGITATNCGGGISTNNSTNITIKNSNIVVTDPAKEALKVGESSGTTGDINLVVENSTLSCVGGKAVIFRQSTNGTASISNSDIIGSIENLSASTVGLAIEDTTFRVL